MEARYYHGQISPQDVVEALLSNFNRGTLRAQQVPAGDQAVVQISTQVQPQSGGYTAIAVTITPQTDGILVQIGEQDWLGIAASLGKTAFSAWRNPLNLLGRLDDLAEDIGHIQIADKIWEVINSTARTLDASFQLSERLRRTVCPYCSTANPVGESNCIACGAPLGEVQPGTCSKCGFTLTTNDLVCPNCGTRLNLPR